MELEQLVTSLQKEKQELSESVTSHVQNEEKYREEYIALRDEVLLVQEQAKRFSSNGMQFAPISHFNHKYLLIPIVVIV